MWRCEILASLMSWTLQGNVKYIHVFGTMKTCEILTLLVLDTMTTYKTLTHFISWTLRRHVKYLQYSCLVYHVDTFFMTWILWRHMKYLHYSCQSRWCRSRHAEMTPAADWPASWGCGESLRTLWRSEPSRGTRQILGILATWWTKRCRK